MNRLPPELLTYIISFLPANEILKCKKVNSQWRSIIDNNIRLKNLVITDDNLLFPKWSFTYQLVNCYDWIKKFYSIDELIFKNVNQLYIQTIYWFSSISMTSDKLNALNQLKRLEVVNIRLRENFIINLPNLTHLALVNVSFEQISLNTPNLSHLRVHGGLDDVNFNHPLSIKILELNNYNSNVINFSNLEYLYCKNIGSIDQNFLIKMPNLKEIHFNQYDYYTPKEVFQSLKIQKNHLKRDLKIYNYGMNLVDLPDIELDSTEDRESKNTTNFLCENYDKLAETVPFIYSINYSVLEYRFVSIPVDFTSKFVNIRRVTVENKLDDIRQFIEFLKNYRNLRSLHLKNSSLNQSFIDNLPDQWPNLMHLSIFNERVFFNFEPILALKNLQSFNTDQKLEDLYFVHSLFLKTRVTYLEFFYLGKKIELNFWDDKFAIRRYSDDWYSFCSFDDNFCQKFAEFERSDYWKNLTDYESDGEMNTNYESDEEIDYESDKSIYKFEEINSNNSNVIKQFSDLSDESETD